jgi:hypothetical protein
MERTQRGQNWVRVGVYFRDQLIFSLGSMFTITIVSFCILQSGLREFGKRKENCQIISGFTIDQVRLTMAYKLNLALCLFV